MLASRDTFLAGTRPLPPEPGGSQRVLPGRKRLASGIRAGKAVDIARAGPAFVRCLNGGVLGFVGFDLFNQRHFQFLPFL
jgi:hypothetical protein